ncbi:MAG: hypothetical protein J6S85_11010 [Methanobrevibacter sp.]|nr:hypothetical protein [Methanobrevibacter sp.]
MAKLSKIEYEALKALNPEDLTSEDRRDIIDFERAEAQAPSLDDVEWATEIHNMASKNPSTVGAELKAIGDYDKALKILEQETAYNNVKGGSAKDTYVQPVKRIPDDLSGDFDFNWKSVYENTKGEKLRDTEADYDKLKKFIDSNMYDINDQVNLQKIAYDLHMYNPNTMKWSEFINSEQGNEFKKYVKDVEKYQKNKAIDAIFSGEEPTKVNYPLLGPTDVPGSNFLVDFGLPVSKQAAYNAVKKGEDPELGAAMAIDLGSNALMALQPGSKAVSPIISKGSNFLVPAVQNAAQVAINDEDPLAAGVNTLVGGSINLGTPLFLNKYGSKLSRWNPGETGYSRNAVIKEHIDDLANKAADIKKRLDNGALIKPEPKKFPSVFVNDEKKIAFIKPGNKEVRNHYKDLGYTIKDLKEMRYYDAGILTEKEYDFYNKNKSLIRGKWAKSNASEPKFTNSQMDSMFKNLWTKEYKGQKTINELNKQQLEILLGKEISESRWNWLKRNMPDALKDYLTNAAGRSQMGNSFLNVPQMIFGANLGKLAEERKNKKPKISEIFGE